METKLCKVCGVEKPLYQFYNSSTSLDGKRNDCKSCKISRYKKTQEENKSRYEQYGKDICGCGRKKVKRSSVCRMCSDEKKRVWHTNTRGYVVSTHRGRQLLQHRVVMEQHLGRKLYDHENVHHKNGVRDDNRLENLELWSTSQPAGQRVEDKIIWAKNFLAQYGE